VTDDRRPIEPLIRSEPMPEDAVVVVRGGPIATEKIVEHARRQEALFTFRGRPMVAISVELTVGGWTLERILAGRMRTRTRYATAKAGALRIAGYELVPTGRAPHYSLILPGSTHSDAAALLARFGPTLQNPYRARR
jgi:hypothetical protein